MNDGFYLGLVTFFLSIVAVPGITQTSLVLHSVAPYLHCGAARNYLSGSPDRFHLFIRNVCSLTLNYKN